MVENETCVDGAEFDPYAHLVTVECIERGTMEESLDALLCVEAKTKDETKVDITNVDTVETVRSVSDTTEWDAREELLNAAYVAMAELFSSNDRSVWKESVTSIRKWCVRYADDPRYVAVQNALHAVQQLHTEYENGMSIECGNSVRNLRNNIDLPTPVLKSIIENMSGMIRVYLLMILARAKKEETVSQADEHP